MDGEVSYSEGGNGTESIRLSPPQGMKVCVLFRTFPDNNNPLRSSFSEQSWDGTRAGPNCGSTNFLSGAKHTSQPYQCRVRSSAT